MDNESVCTLCSEAAAPEELVEFDGNLLCHSCLEENTTLCDRCGERLWRDDAETDDNTTLCHNCFTRHYVRCTQCDRIIHEDDAFYFDDDPYCQSCHNREHSVIHDYCYKPDPIFYGQGSRYMGVELEIDEGGEIGRNAEALLSIGNKMDEHLYCKHDGSLSDGFELVTHPMTLDYHLAHMPWGEMLEKAKVLGYLSHRSGTCGLHVHVNRSAFGETEAEQEASIARVLYFFEKHWEELLKFSRRTQRQLDRWAARYGLKEHPKDILYEAKGGQRYNRYTCVNLTNSETIEFRIFRGTLKVNTLLATLQLLDRICDTAINLSDEQLKDLSWTTFVSGCTQPELVRYLKERRLYVNEPVETEAEV